MQTLALYKDAGLGMMLTYYASDGAQCPYSNSIQHALTNMLLPLQAEHLSGAAALAQVQEAHAARQAMQARLAEQLTLFEGMQRERDTARARACELQGAVESLIQRMQGAQADSMALEASRGEAHSRVAAMQARHSGEECMPDWVQHVPPQRVPPRGKRAALAAAASAAATGHCHQVDRRPLSPLPPKRSMLLTAGGAQGEMAQLRVECAKSKGIADAAEEHAAAAERRVEEEKKV